jgi:hypothetical protein
LIKFKNFFKGFRLSDASHDFEHAYTLANTRRNYHILKFNGSWSVHGEADKEIKIFNDKQSAIAYAKEQAQIQKTIAILHNENGAIETAWAYSPTAYPQEKIYSANQYPLQANLGKNVL